MVCPEGRTPSRARPLRARTTEARERRPVVPNNDPGSRIAIPADDVITHILGRCPSVSTRYSPGRLSAAYRSSTAGLLSFCDGCSRRLPAGTLRRFWGSGSCVTTYISSSTCRRSEEHTSELQSHHELVCRLMLEKKNYYR